MSLHAARPPRIPDRMLRLCLSVVLLASGVKLVGLPHANESAIIVLVVGLVALAVTRRLRLLTPRAPARHSRWGRTSSFTKKSHGGCQMPPSRRPAAYR